MVTGAIFCIVTEHGNSTLNKKIKLNCPNCFPSKVLQLKYIFHTNAILQLITKVKPICFIWHGLLYKAITIRLEYEKITKNLSIFLRHYIFN